MKIKSFRIAVLMSIALYALAWSQASQTGITPNPLEGRLNGYAGIGTRSAEFLNIPTSARGTAMGEAAIALVDDISALYWNPANLGFMTSPQVMFTNVNYTLDFQLNHAAAAVPFGDGQGVYGGFMTILTTQPEEITTLVEPDGTNEYFDGYSMVWGGTFAYNISDRFSAGVNVKWVHEDIYDITGNALSIDVGANYHTEFFDRPIRIAFVVTNLGTNLTFKGERLSTNLLPEDELGRNKYIGTPRPERADRFGYQKTTSANLPLAFKMGIAYQAYADEMNTLNLVGEYQEPNYIESVVSGGVEYLRAFAGDNVMALRAGYKYMSDELDLEGSDRLRGLSLGGGIAHDFWVFNAQVDYAYQHNGLLGNLHFVSLLMTF